jgi:uncharacterized protein (TIGR02001 family)
MNKSSGIKQLAAACSGVMLAGLASSAAAVEGPWGLEFSANVALTTDYVWRGVSQSDEKGAIQGGFDVAHPIGIYVGTWASNVDFDDGEPGTGDPSMELDFYGGYAHEFDIGVGIDLGVINYRYPGQDDFNWTEFYGGASYGFDFGLGINAAINYSNDVFNTDETGVYYVFGADYGFDTKYPITISGSYGYYDFDNDVNGNDLPNSYQDWKIGVSMDVSYFTFDVSYTDTDDDGEDLYGDWADDRFIATVSASF